jgi:hypothetical protein
MKDLTAKEKAKELVDKCDETLEFSTPKRFAKQCALIAVQNIISANPHSNPLNTDTYSTMKWWQDVKSEIEKL